MERSKATQRLEQIAATIDAGTLPGKVKELYVFGSFARGALNVGDLDLILIYEPPSQELLTKLKSLVERKYEPDFWLFNSEVMRQYKILIKKAIRRPGEKMDLLLSDSIDNLTIKRPPESVLIWSQEHRDWRQAIAAIRQDPSAGRFARPPFADIRRFNTHWQFTQTVATALNEDVLRLTRTPLETIEPRLNRLYKDFLDHLMRNARVGKKSQRLLPFALYWIQSQCNGRNLPDLSRSKCSLISWDGSCIVYFGRPRLYAVLEIGARTRVCLIPHINRDQPNEMFVFEKGEKWSPNGLQDIRRRRG